MEDSEFSQGSQSPAAKRFRRTKVVYDEECTQVIPWIASKQRGNRFDLLLEDGKATSKVVCKEGQCRAILNKNHGAILSYHVGLHEKVAPVSAQHGMLSKASRRKCKRQVQKDCQGFPAVTKYAEQTDWG